MTVKANWHLAELDLPDDDPMAGISQLQSGRVLDLRKGSDALMEELKDTMRTEARYAQTFDLACEDKWTVDADQMARNPCVTCPLFTADDLNPRSLLCALGRRQESVIDSYLTAKTAEGMDGALLARYEDSFDAAAELAEALL